MTSQTYEIDGLKCGGCVAVVKAAFSALDGVHTVDIEHQTASPSTLTINADQVVDVDTVLQSLDSFGKFSIRR